MSNRTRPTSGNAPRDASKENASPPMDAARAREQRFGELMGRLDQQAETTEQQTRTIEQQTRMIERLERDNAALREQLDEQARLINAQTQATNAHTSAVENHGKAFEGFGSEVGVLRRAVEQQNELLGQLNDQWPDDYNPTLRQLKSTQENIAHNIAVLADRTEQIATMPNDVMNSMADRVMHRVEERDKSVRAQTAWEIEIKEHRRAGWRWWLGLPLKAVAAASLFWGCVVSFPEVLPEPVQLQFATHIVGEDAWVSGNRLMEVGDPYTYGVVKDMVEFVKSPQSDLRRCEAEARAMRRDVECQFPLLVPAPDVPARAQATRNRSPFFNRRTTFRHL